jgi:short-subunit dehydrogenase
VLSWISSPSWESYSASKSALWSQTNALRHALRPRGIGVTGLYVGYLDTDMAAAVDAPKLAPRDVAEQALDGIASDAFEVLADDLSRQVKAGLAADLTAHYPQLAQ